MKKFCQHVGIGLTDFLCQRDRVTSAWLSSKPFSHNAWGIVTLTRLVFAGVPEVASPDAGYFL